MGKLTVAKYSTGGAWCGWNTKYHLSAYRLLPFTSAWENHIFGLTYIRGINNLDEFDIEIDQDTLLASVVVGSTQLVTSDMIFSYHGANGLA